MLPLTVASLYLGQYHGGEGPALDPPDGWSARGHPAAGGLPGSLHAPSRHGRPITGTHPPSAPRGHRPLPRERDDDAGQIQAAVSVWGHVLSPARTPHRPY